MCKFKLMRDLKTDNCAFPLVDVINVVSVTASATVHQWDETNEDEVQPALYWRQAFDVRTMDLSVGWPCSIPSRGYLPHQISD